MTTSSIGSSTSGHGSVPAPSRKGDDTRRSGDHPPVTVSILATFDAHTIEPCVASVLALGYLGLLDTHIREQGGDEAQLAAIERALAAAPPSPLRRVHVARGENVCFAPGNNLAIRAGVGEFVMLVNADAVVAPDLLDHCLPEFDDPRVGAVQPKVLRHPPGDVFDPARRGSIIDTTGLVATRSRRFLNRGMGEVDDGQYDERGEIFGPDGAVPVYRAAALRDVSVPLTVSERRGLGHRRRLDQRDPEPDVEFLDESFFIYKCDIDLAWRLQLRGWKTVYVPLAKAGHGRTMRNEASRSPREILAARRASPPRAKLLSFGNHRLMQIKAESVKELAGDSAHWLPLELATWATFLVTERSNAVKAIARLCRLAPAAYRKRRWIRMRRDPDASPYRWFRGG